MKFEKRVIWNNLNSCRITFILLSVGCYGRLFVLKFYKLGHVVSWVMRKIGQCFCGSVFKSVESNPLFWLSSQKMHFFLFALKLSHKRRFLSWFLRKLAHLYVKINTWLVCTRFVSNVQISRMNVNRILHRTQNASASSTFIKIFSGAHFISHYFFFATTILTYMHECRQKNAALVMYNNSYSQCLLILN